MPQILAQLSVRDGRAALAFYARALRAVVEHRSRPAGQEVIDERRRIRGAGAIVECRDRAE